MSLLLQMQSIEKYFPGVHALQNVHFELKHGEVHALMGENGAGKSTLMKILAGIYTSDAGSIRLGGEYIAPSTPREAQDAGISMIHQELNLMNDLTVAQNIFIGKEPRRRFGLLDESTLRKKTAEIFRTIKLALDVDAMVGHLTIAKQQMVEIAKAMTFRPRVMIMDEPTAALSDTEVAELFEMIRRLKADGVGIIYISHKMNELQAIADRVTVMRDGAYVDTVSVAQTTTQEIISMMVGRKISSASLSIPNLDDAPVMLEVRSLKRDSSVNDVSFRVKAGEILGFAGLMGAGRTEVARVIFGADPLDSGEIWIKGQRQTIQSPADAVKAGIGYLSEDRKRFGLAIGMDVRANITMARLDTFTGFMGILDEPTMKAAAWDYVDQLGIRTPSDRQEVRLLSGGNQQKVVVGKWLLRDCDVLIFDEPTRGIDVGAKAEIYKLLQALAEQGRAIIVISSELPEIMRLSHRIAVMCEGQLTGILPGGDETTQEDIMQLATQRPVSLG